MDERIQLALAGCDHYHATYVRPKWAKGMETCGTFGGHRFYRTTALAYVPVPTGLPPCPATTALTLGKADRLPRRCQKMTALEAFQALLASGER